jgi:hypothetical protein
MARKVQEYTGVTQESDAIKNMVQQLETVCTQACEELETELNRIKTLTNE